MFKEHTHRFFQVGGCVRDSIMGIPCNDFDYVTAMTTDEFTFHFPEAKLVGNVFPVYLLNGNEISLTRSEKSSGNGYGDFVVTGVGVPIEEDLARRDFSVNSVAKNCATGEIIDPYNGVADITSGILRSINPNAFVDDPVRILRLARFATRFGFKIESGTVQSAKLNSHRLKHVTKERIEKELNKCYHSKNVKRISSFFRDLHYLDGLQYIFPEVHEMNNRFAGPEKYHGENSILDHTMNVIDKIEESNGDFKCMISGLFHDLGKINTPEEFYGNGRRQHIGHENRGYDMLKDILKVNRFTSDVNELSLIIAKLHMKVHNIHEMKPSTLIKFYKQIPKRYYEDFFLVCNADHVLSEDQRKVKIKLDKLRDFKYDTERIDKAKGKDKKFEAERQLINYYKSL